MKKETEEKASSLLNNLASMLLMFLGVLLCFTIIGAVIGIPMIIMGAKGYKS